MRKVLICIFCLVPMMANATVTYRVQKTWSTDTDGGTNDSYASRHRFYVGGMYDFSMWQNYTSDYAEAKGKDMSGFDVLLGFRLFDTFRIEADYLNTRAKWSGFSINTNTAFLNMIVDARIDSLYRLFHSQKLVPYIGAGIGATWTSGVNIDVESDTVASFAVLAGVGLELGERFTLDLGYRYVYMTKPGIENVRDIAPNANQIRIGARINF